MERNKNMGYFPRGVKKEGHRYYYYHFLQLWKYNLMFTMDSDYDLDFYSDSSDSEDDEMFHFMQMNAIALMFLQQQPTQLPTDMRGRSGCQRSKRKKRNHERALMCIQSDYLQPDSLIGSEFHQHFRISRTRFQCILEDIMNSRGNAFFKTTHNANGDVVASIEARLLLPLKAYSYGVTPRAFKDYFQMSDKLASECCKKFNKVIIKLYAKEYLRKPTTTDVQSIVKLHKAKHGVDGMLGSLDCTQTFWKNCPVAWSGQFKGRYSSPSIVLEAVADYNLWFWHLSYGHCGCLNDINILNRSPLFNMMLDGTLHELEKEAGVVPFKVLEESFEKLFFLVDGIYPNYNRFVKSIKCPITGEQRRFSKWQEGARKDVERAFGVLKACWQVLARPIMLHLTSDIAEMATCCFILHNMNVSDRVMGGNCRAVYVPSATMYDVDVEQQETVEATVDRLITPPRNLTTVQAKHNQNFEHLVPPEREELGEVVTRGDRFKDLKDVEEYKRLIAALMAKFGATRRSYSGRSS